MYFKTMALHEHPYKPDVTYQFFSRSFVITGQVVEIWDNEILVVQDSNEKIILNRSIIAYAKPLGESVGARESGEFLA